MEVLLTGASGFIGGYVLKELLARNNRVLVLSRRPFHHSSPLVRNVICDLHDNNFSQLTNLPQTVIHLAWADLPNYKEDFHLKKNLPAQKIFITHLIANGCNNINITGTCMEYGLQNGCLTENMLVNPTTPYAKAKDELRKYIEGFENIISFKWIRLFYMYGKGQSPKSIIPQLHEAVNNNLTTFNMSGGEQVRDYLAVEQVAKNIVDISLQQKVTGIINCGSGNPLKLKDFIEHYKKTNGLDIPLNLGYYPYPDYEPMEFWGDIRKLKEIQDNDTK